MSGLILSGGAFLGRDLRGYAWGRAEVSDAWTEDADFGRVRRSTGGPGVGSPRMGLPDLQARAPAGDEVWLV